MCSFKGEVIIVFNLFIYSVIVCVTLTEDYEEAAERHLHSVGVMRGMLGCLYHVIMNLCI